MSRRTSSAKNSDAANLGAGLAHLHAERLGLGLLAILSVTKPFSTMRSITQLRRAIARSGIAERVVVARRLGKRGEIGAVGDARAR